MRIALISDLHVSQSAVAPPALARVVTVLAALRPDAVVLGGDMTSGNDGDRAQPALVATWWAALAAALAPLHAAGIPVLPIAGNHDFYSAAHRDGYRAAFSDLAARVPFPLSGTPPLNYSATLGAAHLSFAHVVDQALLPETAAFLRADLASPAARAARVRLVFGHVPLFSAMGHTNPSFRDALGRLLAEGRADLYASGHEHLVWDEVLPTAAGSVRQLIIGTACAGYRYPLRDAIVRDHARGLRCRMPASGRSFALAHAGDGHQAFDHTFALLDLDDSGLHVRPMALNAAGEAVDFYLPDEAQV